MRTEMTKAKWLVAIVTLVAMLGVLACGGADEEVAPAAAPAPAPVIDTAAIAAEVAKSVAASAPETASPQEIQKMVEAAIAAQARPGVTKAEIEAAIAASAGKQLSASEIKSIVDASIKALPAPELDLTKLRSLVEQSVKASVPKGTSAAEIQRMVEAAVTAASADVATRGDMEAAVSQAVMEASADQLTAAEVQKIVDASLSATEAAETQAAMAVKQAEATAMMVAKARTDPRLLARTTEGGQVTYVWDGPMPAKFNEAPMSAELVKAGKLPPLEDRLPSEPGVVPPNEAIGVYGGTWRMHYSSATAGCRCGTGPLVAWDGDGSRRIPHMAKDFQVSDDGRVITMILRKGQKWSNGDPFTTEDFRFTWEDIGLNEELSPTFDPKFRSPISGNPAKFEVVDEVTMRWTFDDPNYEASELWYARQGHSNRILIDSLFNPSTFLKQFHPKYASTADLAKELKAAELDNWIALIKAKVYENLNIDKPTTSAWAVVDDSTGAEWILERNHYYYAVDPAGNQLPYIDRIHLTLVEDSTAGNFLIAAGDIDYQGGGLQQVPLFNKNAERGNFYVFLRNSDSPSDGVININQTFVKDPVIGDLLRTRDFRRALSLASDRDQINEIVFLGTGATRAYVPAPGTLYYPGKKWEKMFAVRDLAEANRLLDGIGLTDKDADGIRLRPDGEPLVLHFDLLMSSRVNYAAMAELLQAHWEEVGIGVTYKVVPRAHHIIQNGDGYLFLWTSGSGFSPWIGATFTIPNRINFRSAPEIGRHFVTDGKEGVPANDPMHAGADGNFPFQMLRDWHSEGKAYPMTSPERIELGKKIYKLHATEVIYGSTVSGTQPAVVKNNLRNVPKNVASHVLHGINGPRQELHYYESPLEEGQRSPWRSN